MLLLLVALTGCNLFSQGSATPVPSGPEPALMQTIRHYYEVVNQVRATGDASLIDPVTDPDGVDRSNVQAFVAGQRARGHLSIVTANVFSNWKFRISGNVAMVHFDLLTSGYDIDAVTREPVESPMTLPLSHMVMELRHHDSGWLVFNRQAVANGS